MKEPDIGLPPLLDELSIPDRQYRTVLPARLYSKLETMALARGITPFKYTTFVMVKYLKGELIEKLECEPLEE